MIVGSRRQSAELVAEYIEEDEDDSGAATVAELTEEDED